MLNSPSKPMLPEEPEAWDDTMKQLEVAMSKPTLAAAVHDANTVPIRVTCDSSVKILSMVSAIHVIDEAVHAVIDNLASTHDMTRALFGVYGCHATAINNASQQMAKSMHHHIHAAAEVEKQEAAAVKAELQKLHCQVLHNQSKMEPVLNDLARNVQVILAGYKELKQRIDVLETDKLPASPNS